MIPFKATINTMCTSGKLALLLNLSDLTFEQAINNRKKLKGQIMLNLIMVIVDI